MPSPLTVTADQQRIRDLEHAESPQIPAVVPLGSDPDHCGICAAVAATAALQADCPHDPDDRETVDFTSGTGLVSRYIWCGACGQTEPFCTHPDQRKD